MLILRKPWTSQPPRSAGLILDTELAFSWVGSEFVRTAYPSSPVFAVGNATRLYDANGIGVSFASTANIGLLLNNSTTLTPGWDRNRGFTIVLYAAPKPASVWTMGYSCANPAAGTGIEIYANFNATKTGAVSSGTFSAYLENGGADALAVIDGKPHVFVITISTFNKAFARVYVDGIDRTTSQVQGKSDSFTSLCADTVGGYRNSGFASTDPIYLCQGYTRAWSPTEIAGLGNDPWKLFRPRTLVVPPVSAIVPPTLLAASATSITTSSAIPRVTFTRP